VTLQSSAEPASTVQARPAQKGAQTLRGHRRRNLILKVASELFATRRYDGVSINDIGTVAGVTGPAIYRYFDSKEQVLVSIYEDLQGRYREGLQLVTSSDDSPEAMLEALIDLNLSLALEHPEKIRIITNEDRHLPADVADRLRQERGQHLRIWASLLREVHPDWNPEEADATVHAIFSLINSISLRRHSEPVPNRVVQHLRMLAILIALGPPKD
jgi:AcrR family transcriptional regulator